MNNTIQQPRISTLTVEISVIKIGNNKMTLSVFDQLYHGDPFDENFKIIHPVWGKVNRNGDDYIIFQKDNELRKYIIGKPSRLRTFDQAVKTTLDYRYDDDFYMPLCNEIKKDKLKNDFSLEYKFKEDVNFFIKYLSDEERNKVLDEYNNILSNESRYNKAIGILKESNQLFIAV